MKAFLVAAGLRLGVRGSGAQGGDLATDGASADERPGGSGSAQ